MSTIAKEYPEDYQVALVIHKTVSHNLHGLLNQADEALDQFNKGEESFTEIRQRIIMIYRVIFNLDMNLGSLANITEYLVLDDEGDPRL